MIDPFSWGEKWPGRIFITRWRWWLEGTKGWKKKGWVWEESTSVRPPISPHLVSALRLHVCDWCCCARQPQGFLFRKEPKTRAIPLRLGQTLLGFRAVRSPLLLQEKLSVSQSVSLLRLFPTPKFCLFHLTTHSAWYQHSKRCHGYDKYQRRRNRKKLV